MIKKSKDAVLPNPEVSKSITRVGQQNGLVDKGACHKPEGPEFDPQEN